MNKDMIKKLAEWIESLKDDAENDNPFDIAWFSETKNKPFSIIGGWMDGFSENYSNLLCISKSNPSYAMAIKIAVNEGPYAYTDFETMNMPVNDEGDVEDTCIALDYDEDATALAQFYAGEWERLMKEYNEEADENEE